MHSSRYLTQCRKLREETRDYPQQSVSVKIPAGISCETILCFMLSLSGEAMKQEESFLGLDWLSSVAYQCLICSLFPLEYNTFKVRVFVTYSPRSFEIMEGPGQMKGCINNAEDCGVLAGLRDQLHWNSSWKPGSGASQKVMYTGLSVEHASGP